MKICTKCKRDLPDECFNKANWLNSGLRSDCKECYAKTKKAYWDRKGLEGVNAVRSRELRKERALGVRTCRTCGETKPLDTAHFGDNGSGFWSASCRPCVAKRVRVWSAQNTERAKINAYANCAARNAAKKRRTPKWLTKEQRAEIKAIYAKCREIRKSGHDYEVDHIVPLQGKTVSGLHVPWNLRIVSGSYNRMKLNRVDVP